MYNPAALSFERTLNKWGCPARPGSPPKGEIEQPRGRIGRAAPYGRLMIGSQSAGCTLAGATSSAASAVPT